MATTERTKKASPSEFFLLKQETMKQAHSKNQHPSKQVPPKLIHTHNNKPIPDSPPLYHVQYRKEIRLKRYLNQHHQFICALEPCFTTIVPFLTIDDIVRLSSVCGILNNWVLAEVVWKTACMAQTQYADIVRRHLRAKTWYQLAISLYDDKFNPFRCYIPLMHNGCVNLLRECLLKLLHTIRLKCIANPGILSLSVSPTLLFDTEWLFRCCVSLRNDRHGTVPQGLLPRLFQSILKEYCKSLKHTKPMHKSIVWLVSEWAIYRYIIERLAMLTSKIDDHSHNGSHTVPVPLPLPLPNGNHNGSHNGSANPHNLDLLINKCQQIQSHQIHASVHASVCSKVTTTTTHTTTHSHTHTTSTTTTESSTESSTTTHTTRKLIKGNFLRANKRYIIEKQYCDRSEEEDSCNASTAITTHHTITRTKTKTKFCNDLDIDPQIIENLIRMDANCLPTKTKKKKRKRLHNKHNHAFKCSGCGELHYESISDSSDSDSDNNIKCECPACNNNIKSYHFQLFGEYLLLLKDSLCCEYWRKLAKDLEMSDKHRLLSACAAIFESVGLKQWPKRWKKMQSKTSTLRSEKKVSIYYKHTYFSISRSAALLSPYIREFMGRADHCIVDLTWIDGEKHHLKKLLLFLEYHISEPMPHIPTPVRSKKLSRVVPKWYADFAMQCDRKDCFIMILIGNGLAIAPLVHLFCARIATMIKSLKPNEVREIMALEEDVQRQERERQEKAAITYHINDSNSIPF